MPSEEFALGNWTPLDEELAIHVMGWELVELSQYPEIWPAWPRHTKMRKTWMVEDPDDAVCRVQAEPGTGIDGAWEPWPIPSFSKTMDEVMRLVPAMREKKLSMKIDNQGPAWRVEVVSMAKGIISFSMHESLQMAIAVAALEAVKREA